ncbi:CBS domain-containing protein [Rhodococcus sp. SRB_17]|uniref:CBS domain-containing protein n=1 Tax=Rhodococcus sp. OK302 TaxID=1882769 RepID=UPI000B944510|nr:CBS domain-containing protein [Rhodococcus sp. OK302]NMM89599.1 CBS domain-containing protein [Rhodococcus sp. SRB_17]OYD71027.1 CBS domain protein [Rhodococcus sp. OK302]
MLARHIMSSPATTIDQATGTDECLLVISRSGFSVLPVIDEQKHLVGIVSEGDLLRSRFQDLSQNDQPASGGDSVADVMTKPVIAMTADAEINAVASAMLRSGLRAVPIVHEGDVIGIVTRQDLIGVLALDPDRIVDEVRHRLDLYGGPDLWAVEFADGTLTISGVSEDDPQRGVVIALASSVPGVDEIRLQP